MSEQDEKVFPLTNWDLGPIIEHGLIVFRPHFISSPEQTINEAQISRYYALTLEQARELKLSLEDSIQQLENIQ